MARNDSYSELRRQTQLMRREAQRARFNHLMSSRGSGDGGGKEGIYKMTAEEREIWRELLKYDLDAANKFRRKCEGPSRATVEVAATFLVVLVIALVVLAIGVNSVGGWRF